MARADTAAPADYIRAFDTLDTLVGMVEAVNLNGTRSAQTALPVVIVTGFLGAGKTTLMRHLLTTNHGLKIAAMVNDFAALNIDAALIADVTEDTTALANGCICCSLSSGVARGLAEIAARDVPVDAVLIEASGVSDPAGIAQVAGTVEGVSLDCIVTVVDAAEHVDTADWAFLLQRQVAPANLVLLNKTDLVPKSEVEAIAGRLAGLAPKAQILRTSQCAVPPVVIFDAASAPALDGGAASPHMDHGFTTLVLHGTQPVTCAEMDAVLQGMPPGILRVKGFLRIAGMPEQTMLLQGVGRRWSWHAAPDGPDASKLVVIGPSSGMDSERVAQHFARLGFEAEMAQG